MIEKYINSKDNIKNIELSVIYLIIGIENEIVNFFKYFLVRVII